jgi:hypothetical protein
VLGAGDDAEFVVVADALSAFELGCDDGHGKKGLLFKFLLLLMIMGLVILLQFHLIIVVLNLPEAVLEILQV